MKIAPGEIGFDIDGVVADTMEAFIRLAARDFAILVRPEQITDFMVEKCLDMDPRVIENIFGRLMKSPLEEGLQPISDALSVLHDLAEQAPLTFITARPDPAPIAACWKNIWAGRFSPGPGWSPPVTMTARLPTSGNWACATLSMIVLRPAGNWPLKPTSPLSSSASPGIVGAIHWPL